MKNGPSKEKSAQSGHIVVLLLAIVAAIGILSGVVAKHRTQQRRLAEKSYLDAVLRNLAEGGIAAGAAAIRMGRAPTRGELFSDQVGPRRAKIHLGAKREKGGGWTLTSTATLEPSSAPLRYVLVATLPKSQKGEPTRFLRFERKIAAGK